MSQPRPDAFGGSPRRALHAASVLLILAAVGVMTGCRQEPAGSANDVPYQLSEIKEFDPRQLSLPAESTAVTDDRGYLRALNSPELVPADDGGARYLAPTDRIVGLTLGGQPRAYPLRVVEYHQVVNDMAGDVPVLVTYCPLTDSSAVYQRDFGGQVRSFEVTSLLHNSNLLFYDQTNSQESVWVQLTGKAVSGPAEGQQLQRLPYIRTRWAEWVAQHPDTLVMSLNTGGPRQDYNRYRYSAYFGDPNALWYEVNPLDKSHGLREPAIVVHAGSEVKAYAYSQLSAVGEPLEDTLAGKRFTIELDRQTETANIVHAEEGVLATHAFWWAWHSFHPQAPSFQAGS